MPTQFNWPRVIVIRRSSRSFGRMEIRSSSEASQFMTFIARSRLPLKLIKELAANANFPPTQTGLRRSSFLVFRERVVELASGPFLFLGWLGWISEDLTLL